MGLNFYSAFLINVIFLSAIKLILSQDVFTSMADVQNLLYSKKECFNLINDYITDEEQRLAKIKEFIKQNEEKYGEEDAEYYISNPINAYLLIKSLTKDWKTLESFMRNNVSETYINKISSNVFMPGEQDLNGAAVALFRLQDMYKVDTNKMAQGDISGVKTSPSLNAEQCFELGRQSYLNDDFYHTRIWMEEALRKYESEEEKSVKLEDILEYLAFALYKQGNVYGALKKTEELLTLNPFHNRAQGNKEWYQKDLDELERAGKKGDEWEPTNAKLEDEYANPEIMNYHSLCRGDFPMDPLIARRLKCKYVNKHKSPLLILAPAMEEQVGMDPNVYLYHHVINDREMNVVKQLASPKLKRATAFNAKTQRYEPADYRISKSAWLKEEDHTVIKDINKRISAITGLSMETAEDLQVANYGIGGHYDPHYDFSRSIEKDAFNERQGNRIATFMFYEPEYDNDGKLLDQRIATWMFYMSDVLAGGATVFPLAGIRSTPRRGSAVFWYNLKASGAGDFNTRHAACPVLAGSKWVANKWIHERGQEFLRPCRRNPDL